MTPRAIFLDVDGTYADHGVPPQAHVDAVRAARAAGHRVLLCTGRSVAMLSETLLAAGFDGVVASAGAYVAIDGEVLADRRYPGAVADRAVRVLDEAQAAYILEAPEALYAHRGLVDAFNSVVARQRGISEEEAGRQTGDILAGLRIADDLAGVSFAKITVMGSPVPTPVLTERIGPEVAVLPSSIPDVGEAGGEIYLADIHKALGMRAACEHLGIPLADAVGVGDGLNDLEMLAEAGTAVAIEGADPRLLALADLVVPGPRDEGLVTAFETLGLV